MRINATIGRRIVRALTASAVASAMFAMAACAPNPEADTTSGALGNSTVSIPIQRIPNSLDPAQLSEGQEAYVWTALYDTLLYMDNDGEIKPNAAESWSYSTDAKTLTLKLRDDLTFSTGAAIRSDAVKATLDRTRETPGVQQAQLSAVESIEAPDELTVVLKLKEASAGLLASLTRGVGVIGDPATLNEKTTATNPVSSGAYTLNEQATVSGTTYVLDRRDDYWNAKAYPFKTLTIRVLADRTAAFNALLAGEVDVASVDVAQKKQLEASDGGHSVTNIPASSVAKLLLLDRQGEILPPLKDVRVRQAINMALDRKKMVQQLLGGNGVADDQETNPTGPGYDSQLSERYKYDPAGAKKLLADAGYPDGFSFSIPSTFSSHTFEPTITQMLGDVGIKVTWDAVPPQKVNADITNKKYPVAFFIDSLNSPGLELTQNNLIGGIRNPFNNQDPTLNTLVQKANAETDPSKAGEIYKEINRFRVENAWNAPLFYVGTNQATTEGIKFVGQSPAALLSVRTLDVAK